MESPVKKRLAILGSTGSIGQQTLQVVESHPDLFTPEVLTANRNAELLIEQALKFEPNIVVIADKSRYPEVKSALEATHIKVFAGSESIEQVVSLSTVDMVVTAMVGYSGLLPTVRAIEAGKAIALANKETLVVAGALITELQERYGSAIIPVDSEHSAIFQCLVGESSEPEKILLTASGGPFRGMKRGELERVKLSDALKHPTWRMGAKVTIDSASLINKGFEAIEARWLFGVSPEKIEVLIHPQSIVHSMVEFADGSVKAQLGIHDMRLPIQYALTFPERVESGLERIDFATLGELDFERPDLESFPALSLAFEALRRGGNIPAALNAANEVAVSAFIEDRIPFTGISDMLGDVVAKAEFIAKPTLDDYAATDSETRRQATEWIEKKFGKKK